MRRQPRLLSDDGGIELPHLPARTVDFRTHLPKEKATGSVAVLRIARGEVRAQIAERCRPKHGIGEGVQEYIAVGMTNRPLPVGNAHSPQPQRPTRSKTMRIEAEAHALREVSICFHPTSKRTP